MGQGLADLRALGLVDGEAPKLVGGQAEGARRSPPRSATAGECSLFGRTPSAVRSSWNPADGDFAVATARDSGGSIHVVAEEAIGENMALLASTTGVFGETAAGVTLGALRSAVDAASSRATPAWCCS